MIAFIFEPKNIFFFVLFYNQGFVTISFIHGFSDFWRKATKLGGRGGEGKVPISN